MSNQRCENCQFYLIFSAECRRYPVFTQKFVVEWCGEWKSRRWPDIPLAKEPEPLIISVFPWVDYDPPKQKPHYEPIGDES